jgi:hypothetical protein
MLTKDGKDQFRQEQMLEVHSVKESLAAKGCPVDIKVIRKALLIDEEPLRVPG